MNIPEACLPPSYLFTGAWWEVDLKTSHAIAKVEIRNRGVFAGRLSNSQVILKEGGTPVATYDIVTAETNELLSIPAKDFSEDTTNVREGFTMLHDDNPVVANHLYITFTNFD